MNTDNTKPNPVDLAPLGTQTLRLVGTIDGADSIAGTVTIKTTAKISGIKIGEIAIFETQIETVAAMPNAPHELPATKTL